MDNLDALIGEIRAKNGVTIGRDDPIMMLVTIVDQIARNYDDAQKRNLAVLTQELESAARRILSGACSESERIVNASIAASHDETRKTLSSADELLRQTITKLSASIATRVNDELKMTRIFTIYNIMASVIILLAVMLPLVFRGG